jgi:tRNA-splicing endonuclease subunit Sen54
MWSQETVSEAAAAAAERPLHKAEFCLQEESEIRISHAKFANSHKLNKQPTMADLDDDITAATPQDQSNDDNDLIDDLPDFRFLASLSSKSAKLPKRGEKDFEPHGTKHQGGILEASRQAMHDALSHTRVHPPKAYLRGYYYGEDGLSRDEAIAEELRRGLDDDHIVVVESSKGPHFKTMGKTTQGYKYGSIWLLPEEALYLVERGNLDLWWPTRSSFASVHEGIQGSRKSTETDDQAEGLGVPMSLQAAYAMLIGKDGERGKVSLERYTVYANLKRTGYAISRAPDWSSSTDVDRHSPTTIQRTAESPSFFTWLFGRFAQREGERPLYGPLVRPGMYRSYSTIYRQIAIIPRHKPCVVPPEPAPSPEEPFRVAYFLWRASRLATFAKSNPGAPDFRVAIADARSSSVPTLMQVTSLLKSTPWDPPNPDWEGNAKSYGRLKHGWRNVVLAVNDQGVISYLQLGEAAFGEEQMYERFDGGSPQGAKRGVGGAQRGTGGRGRGRGGRGGRGRGRSGGRN